MEKQEKNTASPYELDGRPPLKVAIPLGLQCLWVILPRF